MVILLLFIEVFRVISQIIIMEVPSVVRMICLIWWLQIRQTTVLCWMMFIYSTLWLGRKESIIIMKVFRLRLVDRQMIFWQTCLPVLPLHHGEIPLRNILFSLSLVVVNIIMMIVTMLTFRFVGMDLPVSEQINIGELFGQSGLCGISVRRSSCKNINGLLMRK